MSGSPPERGTRRKEERHGTKPTGYDHRIADVPRRTIVALLLRYEAGEGWSFATARARVVMRGKNVSYPGQPILPVWLSVAAIMAPTPIVIVIVDLAHHLVAGGVGPLQLACC
ncbi:hypothetical protein C8F01DRAFT_1249480 [Mycena amicta]|nr:hypothetical protein C8F01DRAFT_1249480 [Mycena amicta]